MSFDSLSQVVTKCFSHDGWLVKSRGFTHEPAQLSYALGVVNWLEGKESQPLGFLEGATGVGKSLGYLVPLLAHLSRTGNRGCVATHTLFLQDQLLEADTGDISTAQAYLSAMGLVQPKIAQLIGRHHYIDPLRFEMMLIGCIEDGIQISNKKELIAGAYECAEAGGRIETFIDSYGPFPQVLDVESCCLGEETDNNPAYIDQRQRASDADLVITSHAMLLLNRGRLTGNIFESKDRPISHVVIDEADLLPNTAKSLSSKKLRPTSIKRSFNQFRHISQPITRDWIAKLAEHCDNLKGELDQRAARVYSHKPVVFLGKNDRFEQSVLREAAYAKDAAGVIMSTLRKKRLHADHELRVLIDEAEEVTTFLDAYCGDNRTNAIGVSWTPSKLYPTLELTRAFPGERIKSYFLDKERANSRVLFTSATLTNGRKGGFENFKGEIQIFGDSLCCEESVHEPVSFGDCGFVLAEVSKSLPVLRLEDQTTQLSSAWLDKAASQIQYAARTGPSLCLTVSHKESESLAKRINGVPVHIHRPGVPLDYLVNELEKAGGVIISPSCWHGVSIRSSRGKQLFTNLIISRMPFSPPSPFWEQAMHTHFKAKGYPTKKIASLVWAMSSMDVVRKLRQGFGRLIRQRNDSGFIWICDPRFKPADQLPGRIQASSLANAVPARFWENYTAATIFDSASDSALAPAKSFELPEEIATWL